MAYTEAELLRIRMDCLFTCEAGRMLYVNEPWRQTVPAPLLHAGRTLGGRNMLPLRTAGKSRRHVRGSGDAGKRCVGRRRIRESSGQQPE